MSFNLVNWNSICGEHFLEGPLLEKCGKIWKKVSQVFHLSSHFISKIGYLLEYFQNIFSRSHEIKNRPKIQNLETRHWEWI